MIAEMRIERLAPDQLRFHFSKPPSFTFQVEEERTYVISQGGAPREVLPLTTMPNGSSPPISRPSRTYTLPEIPTGGVGGLVARSPRHAGKIKQRSNSFIMNDTKFLSRSDPVRRTWDGSYSPRRQNKEVVKVKIQTSNGASSSLRSGTLRDSFNSDTTNQKNKSRSFSTNKQSSKGQKARRKMTDDDGGQESSHRSNELTESCDPYEFDTQDGILTLPLEDSVDSKRRKVDFYQNAVNIQDEAVNTNSLIHRTRQLSFNESSDDDQESLTARTPKSILKKKELGDLDIGIRRNQGVSFNDCKVNCKSSVGLPLYPQRQRSFSMPIYSPRPEITFTCSREFAAAMEDLEETKCDNVFHDT